MTENAEAGVLGICFVDVATGCFSLGQCHEEEGKHRLRTLVAQLQPSEVRAARVHRHRLARPTST